jgi:hypothetical protein
LPIVQVRRTRPHEETVRSSIVKVVSVVLVMVVVSMPLGGHHVRRRAEKEEGMGQLGHIRGRI